MSRRDGSADSAEPAFVAAGAAPQSVVDDRWADNRAAIPILRALPRIAWLTAPVVRRIGAATRDAWRRRLMAFADATAAATAWVLTDAWTITAATSWHVVLFPVLGWMAVSSVQGLNTADARRIYSRTVDEVDRLLVCAVLVALIAGLLVDSFTYRDGAGLVAALVLMACATRTAARAFWRRAVAPERAVIIGDGVLGRALARKLVLEPGHHIGITSGEQYGLGHRSGSELTAVGQLAGKIDRVIIAREDLDERLLADIVVQCRAANLKLSVAPPIHASLGSAAELNHVAELPLIEFRSWSPPPTTLFLKRAFDVVVAAALLSLLLPLFVMIVIAIRLESRGPVLFRQERAGRRGRPFTILKFRSMVQDAETRLVELVDVESLEQPAFKVERDPRITRAGSLLRRTSLDELPQLFNVLKGDMSLVGPRPEDVRLVARWEGAARLRLAMRPGLTGPMQVHGRARLGFEERVAVDREYVENYSFGKDLKILLRTINAVISGNGAY